LGQNADLISSYQAVFFFFSWESQKHRPRILRAGGLCNHFANIVAIFLMRIVGKKPGRLRRKISLARAITQKRKIIKHRPRLGIGFPDLLFPSFGTILTSSRRSRRRLPITDFFSALMDGWPTTRRVLEAVPNYGRLVGNSYPSSRARVLPVLAYPIRLPAAWSMAFVPSKRHPKDILLWIAVDQDACSGRCALPDSIC